MSPDLRFLKIIDSLSQLQKEWCKCDDLASASYHEVKIGKIGRNIALDFLNGALGIGYIHRVYTTLDENVLQRQFLANYFLLATSHSDNPRARELSSFTEIQLNSMR